MIRAVLRSTVENITDLIGFVDMFNTQSPGLIPNCVGYLRGGIDMVSARPTKVPSIGFCPQRGFSEGSTSHQRKTSCV